jgi:hypothetical protein
MALTNGIGRAVIGGLRVAAPGQIARLWLGPSAPVETGVLGRALGARDLALGAGGVGGGRRGEPAHAWGVAAARADGGDASGWSVAS